MNAINERRPRLINRTVFNTSSRRSLAASGLALVCVVTGTGLAPTFALANHVSTSPSDPVTNPFAAFFGEWTLKNDRFQQVWDGKTVETLTIPGHHTRCAEINTQRSVLCVVSAGELKGHILWSYDSDTRRVHHLSHFGTTRNGVGVGTMSETFDLSTKVSFQGEPAGNYREYRYTWVSRDEYTMMSTQFDSAGRPTGNWYGGTFVRLPSQVPASDSSIQPRGAATRP